MCQIQIVSIGVNIGEGCYKMIRCDKNRGGLLRKCVMIRFREGYCSTSELKRKRKLCNLTYPFSINFYYKFWQSEGQYTLQTISFPHLRQQQGISNDVPLADVDANYWKKTGENQRNTSSEKLLVYNKRSIIALRGEINPLDDK